MSYRHNFLVLLGGGLGGYLYLDKITQIIEVTKKLSVTI